MTTKTKIDLKTLKKALQEDKKSIKKIKFFSKDNYTVTQNEEIKEALLYLANGFLDVLVHWKDFEETSNLIEYKDDVYNFDDSELEEYKQEIFNTTLNFFDLSMEEQDQILDRIILEENPEPFSFWDFLDDYELNILRGRYLSDEDYSKALGYFSNIRSLRENLI